MAHEQTINDGQLIAPNQLASYISCKPSFEIEQSKQHIITDKMERKIEMNVIPKKLADSFKMSKLKRNQYNQYRCNKLSDACQSNEQCFCCTPKPKKTFKAYYNEQKCILSDFIGNITPDASMIRTDDVPYTSRKLVDDR